MKKQYLLLLAMLLISVLASGCSSPSGNLIQPNYEKKYIDNVMDILFNQLEIDNELAQYVEQYTNEIDLSNGMDNKAYCAYYKIAYDDTKENYNRLASLDVPTTLQSQHKILLSYFKNYCKATFASYNWCMSEIYSNQRSIYLTEMAEYTSRMTEDWYEFTAWVYELEEKDPEKYKMWTKGPNPLLSISS